MRRMSWDSYLTVKSKRRKICLLFKQNYIHDHVTCYITDSLFIFGDTDHFLLTISLKLTLE